MSEDSPVWSTFNTTNDGYLVIGAFNDFGIAEGVIDPKIGELKELRLHVYSDSQNWVILREVVYKVASVNYSIQLFFHLSDIIARRNGSVTKALPYSSPPQ